MISHALFFTSELCEAIQVTGDTSNSEGGLYELSNERSLAAPNSSVWKKSGGNRFIFNTGTSLGWRIGQEKSLTTGGYFCKSKHILMILTIASIYFLNIISRWFNGIANYSRGMEWKNGLWKQR